MSYGEKYPGSLGIPLYPHEQHGYAPSQKQDQGQCAYGQGVPPAPPATVFMNGTPYEVVPCHARQCVVDVTGGDFSPGTPLQLVNPSAEPHQQFRYMDRGNGYFSLLPMHTENLGAVHAEIGEQCQCTMQKYDLYDPRQQWRLQPGDSGGAFYVLSRVDEQKCLGCADGGAEPGTKLVIGAALLNAPHQQFTFRQARQGRW